MAALAALALLAPLVPAEAKGGKDVPFQASASFLVGDGFSEVCSVLTTVPAGRQLVVEYVSAVLRPPFGQQSRLASVTTFVGGAIAYHQVRAQPTGVFNESVVAQVVRLNAEAATAVNFCASRDAHTGDMNVLVTLAGVLVEAP